MNEKPSKNELTAWRSIKESVRFTWKNWPTLAKLLPVPILITALAVFLEWLVTQAPNAWTTIPGVTEPMLKKEYNLCIGIVEIIFGCFISSLWVPP